MALTPKERADFDEIVLRLRLEDARLGDVRPKHRASAFVTCLVAVVLVLGLGVALLGHGALGPLLIVTAVLGGGVASGWVWSRSRRTA